MTTSDAGGGDEVSIMINWSGNWSLSVKSVVIYIFNIKM